MNKHGINAGTPLLLAALCVLLLACNASKPLMAIPDRFAREANKLEIKGIGKGGSQTKKPISFGGYTSSRIKRGWHTTSSRYDRSTSVSTAERVLRAFNFDSKNVTSTEKDKFQFTMQGGGRFSEVYGVERQVTESTTLETNRRLAGDLSFLKNSQYSFSALILTGNTGNPQQWQLVIYGNKSPQDKKGQSFIERNAWDENGFLTNGKDSFEVKAVKLDKVQTKDGKTVAMPFAVMKAYEFRTGDAVSAIVDTFGQVVWMYNQLDKETEFIIACASSAILLRRIDMF